MSNNHPTAEGEPLDPHTLELAIDKLSDRIIDATDERDAEAVRAARSDLIALLVDVIDTGEVR